MKNEYTELWQVKEVAIYGHIRRGAWPFFHLTSVDLDKVNILRKDFLSQDDMERQRRVDCCMGALEFEEIHDPLVVAAKVGRGSLFYRPEMLCEDLLYLTQMMGPKASYTLAPKDSMKTPSNMSTTGLLRVQRKYGTPASTAEAFILAGAAAELAKREMENEHLSGVHEGSSVSCSMDCISDEIEAMDTSER